MTEHTYTIEQEMVMENVASRVLRDQRPDTRVSQAISVSHINIWKERVTFVSYVATNFVRRDLDPDTSRAAKGSGQALP